MSGRDGHATDGRRPGRGGRREGAGRPRQPELDDHILEATIDVLGATGYLGLRVDAVADRAGVAKSTVYRRWPSKAALVTAAIGRLYLDRVEVPDTGNLRADLVALLNNSYDLIIAGPGRVLPELIRDSGQTAEVADLVVETMHARRRIYRQVFNRAIARGEIPPEVDTDLAIDQLWGPLWVRLLVTHQPIGKGAVVHIVDGVLHGLVGAGQRT